MVSKLEELAPIPTVGTKDLVRSKALIDKLSAGLRSQVDAVQEMGPALDETGLELPRQDSLGVDPGFIAMINAVRSGTPNPGLTAAEATPEVTRNRIHEIEHRLRAKS